MSKSESFTGVLLLNPYFKKFGLICINLTNSTILWFYNSINASHFDKLFICTYKRVSSYIIISLFFFFIWLVFSINMSIEKREKRQIIYSRNGNREYHRSCGYQRMIWEYCAQLYMHKFARWNGLISCKAQAYTTQNNFSSFLTIKKTEVKILKILEKYLQAHTVKLEISTKSLRHTN